MSEQQQLPEWVEKLLEMDERVKNEMSVSRFAVSTSAPREGVSNPHFASGEGA